MLFACVCMLCVCVLCVSVHVCCVCFFVRVCAVWSVCMCVVFCAEVDLIDHNQVVSRG